MTLTFASLAREQRSGMVHVSPEAFDEMLANIRALRQWPNAAPLDPDADGSLTFYGPVGKITVRPDPSLRGDARRWDGLNIGRLVADIATAGSSHFRDQQRRRQPETATRSCSYCGAPGQRVGTRCDYCQVAVSR